MSEFNPGNLFAMSEPKEEDFFAKLEEVDTTESVLNEAHTKMIESWVAENKLFNEKIEALKRALGEYRAFVENTPVFGLREDSLYSWKMNDLLPTLQSAETLEPKDKLLAVRVKSFVEGEWGVILSVEEICQEVDLLSAESICEYIAQKTNYGNTEDILLEQSMSAFAAEWKYDKITVKNKKVIASKAFWFSDFDLEYGSMRSTWNTKVQALKELLKVFHAKVSGSNGYSSIDACFSYYERLKVKDLFMKIEEGSKENGDTVMSTRLYKNGKFEIEFSDNDKAVSFYNDYVLRTKGV